MAGLGALAAVLVPRLRDSFALYGALWVGLIVPITLVDWFGVWFIPHRTAAYLSVGLAMLAAVAVEALAEPLRSHGPAWAPSVFLVAIAVVVAAIALPHATGEGDWQRYFDEENLTAWRELDAREPERVDIASWRTLVAYKALTGGQAQQSTGFWYDEGARESYLQEHPNVHVLVDDLTREEGAHTGFLNDSAWEQLGSWGDTTIHRYTANASQQAQTQGHQHARPDESQPSWLQAHSSASEGPRTGYDPLDEQVVLAGPDAFQAHPTPLEHPTAARRQRPASVPPRRLRISGRTS